MLQLCTSFMVHISTIPANLINNSYNASLYSSFSLKRRLVKLKQPSDSRSIRLRSARVFPKDRQNTLARTTKPEALASWYGALRRTCVYRQPVVPTWRPGRRAVIALFSPWSLRGANYRVTHVRKCIRIKLVSYQKHTTIKAVY